MAYTSVCYASKPKGYCSKEIGQIQRSGFLYPRLYCIPA